VLVTGGTGMIGRQVVDILCAADARVRIVSMDRIRLNNSAEHIYGDLTDFALCKEVTRDMDYVFHIAGIKGSANVSATMLASHFVPTLMFNTNVLEACRVNGAKKVLYTSSIGAYCPAEVFQEGEPGNFTDPPMDFAGWAKRMGELQVHAYRMQYGLEYYSVVRPSNVYGPGDNFDPKTAMVVGSLIARIHSGEDPVVVWGDGSAIRDVIFSRDVAEGMILALHHGTQGRYVNLGSGVGYSIRQIVETLRSFLDFNFQFDVTKPSGFPKRVMDNQLARTLIGFEPSTTLAEGLRRTWEWYVEHHDESRNRKNYFTSHDTAS